MMRELGVLLAWEIQGAGTLFRNKLCHELGYANVWSPDREDIFGKPRSDTARIGWNPTKAAQMSTIGEYRDALHNGMMVNHSWHALDETAHL